MPTSSYGSRLEPLVLCAGFGGVVGGLGRMTDGRFRLRHLVVCKVRGDLCWDLHDGRSTYPALPDRHIELGDHRFSCCSVEGWAVDWVLCISRPSDPVCCFLPRQEMTADTIAGSRTQRQAAQQRHNESKPVAVPRRSPVALNPFHSLQPSPRNTPQQPPLPESSPSHRRGCAGLRSLKPTRPLGSPKEKKVAAWSEPRGPRPKRGSKHTTHNRTRQASGSLGDSAGGSLPPPLAPMTGKSQTKPAGMDGSDESTEPARPDTPRGAQALGAESAG